MTIDNGSFRDPSGFVFEHESKILRQINIFGAENYELALSTGLYQALINKNLLVEHKEVSNNYGKGECLYKVIQPEKIDFISYPYEWCFEQLKDAALLTLQIQKISLEHNMTLKDATSYNVQFKNGLPIFIDTLSFEKYEEGTPWVAYKQFCEHFLAPLAIMKYSDIRLSNMLKVFLDGIPLELANKILPQKTKLIPTLMLHIHLHSKSQKKYEDSEVSYKEVKTNISLPKTNLLTLIASLELFIKDLFIGKKVDTEWGDYYNKTNYSDKSLENKKDIINIFLDIVKPKIVWDLGANTGIFSRLASDNGIFTVAFDLDPIAVNKNYVYMKHKEEKKIFPLILDVTNPSANIGWNNEERRSLTGRGRPDITMALALIHHLAISNNVPLIKIAKFLSELSEYLIVEFIPKEDSQVKKLLASRKDVFDYYNIAGFEDDFQHYFRIVKKIHIDGTHRLLYLLQNKGDCSK